MEVNKEKPSDLGGSIKFCFKETFNIIDDTDVNATIDDIKAVNENYKYIHSVASPWDCYQTDFDANAECVGVSLSGIDYLCKNGYSAEEALLWYLPDFEIADD